MRASLWIIMILLGQTACAQEKSSEEVLNAKQKKLHPKCLSAAAAKTRAVTHYYVPLLDKYDHGPCDKMEGTCIYNKDGQQWLHNYGYADQPLSQARCQNGYGNRTNCLHPCRTVAASMRHHHWGEILFLKELVGKRCGTKRDGTEMIHDGFVMVGDTGAISHFNKPGRFDFFWGRCLGFKNGVCGEGAEEISSVLSKSPYCMVWDPQHPEKNDDVRLGFTAQVKREALSRGDRGAADDLDDWTRGPQN